MCEEVPNHPNVLINTIMKAFEKIRLGGDLSSDTLNYFLVKNLKFARFYLLQKIHKHLHDVLGRPVISNCGSYTENISSFLNHYLQPLAQRDTNHFLNKIKKIRKLPEGTILCTMDVVGLYPNMGKVLPLSSFWKLLLYLHLMKRPSNKNVEPLLEPSLRLLMLFFLWLISRKNCLKFLKRKQ